MFEISELCVYYGEMMILRDLSLSIEGGEIVSLLGANGAGKTTAMNAVSGLVRAHSGSISFMGKTITGWSSTKIVDAGLVQVPEGRRIFPMLTVRENLRVGGYSSRARKERAENYERVFTMFPPLRERQRQMAGTLSGGEQQMLAIGRALMAHPILLMLDEPSLGLAPLVVQHVFRIVQEISEKGMTIFLVEQNVRQALSISERAYVLEEGTVTLSGSGKDLAGNDHVRKAFLGM
jgi:branched-chain amino acid transport system ATP-binding protein